MDLETFAILEGSNLDACFLHHIYHNLDYSYFALFCLIINSSLVLPSVEI
jgi:hypothetical protein